MRLNLLLPLTVAAFAAIACSQPEFLVVDPTSVSFERAGETHAISVRGKNRQGIEFPKLMVAWESHDPKVATVDRGIIKSVGHGHTIVEVKTGSISAEIPVEVILVDHVAAKQKELLLAMDAPSVKLDVMAYDPEGHEVRNRIVHTQCKDGEVCSSSGDTVFAINPGKTTVEVSIDNKATTVPVVVVEHAKQLEALRKKLAN
jgi:hypothetical protein